MSFGAGRVATAALVVGSVVGAVFMQGSIEDRVDDLET